MAIKPAIPEGTRPSGSYGDGTDRDGYGHQLPRGVPARSGGLRLTASLEVYIISKSCRSIKPFGYVESGEACMPEEEKLSPWHYRDSGICPWCGAALPEGIEVGTSMKADGAFCSLDCLVKYHGGRFVDRHEQRI
jgi:hypothetical protein